MKCTGSSTDRRSMDVGCVLLQLIAYSSNKKGREAFPGLLLFEHRVRLYLIDIQHELDLLAGADRVADPLVPLPNVGNGHIVPFRDP